MCSANAALRAAPLSRAGKPAQRDYQYATSLVNGLDLLRCFTLAEPLLNNAELSRRSGLSKASVTRITYTLTLLGFLRFDAVARSYRLGSASLSVCYPLLQGLEVRQLARPLMHALAVEVGGSVALGMRERHQMVYVETCRARDLVARLPDIGACVPMLSTAMGRAWLASAPRADAQALRRALRAAQPADWQRLHPAVEAAGRDMAQFGYCFSRGDFQDGAHAAAVPLDLGAGHDLLVFNCAVPAQSCATRAQKDALGARLLALADAVQAAFHRRHRQGLRHASHQ